MNFNSLPVMSQICSWYQIEIIDQTSCLLINETLDPNYAPNDYPILRVHSVWLLILTLGGFFSSPFFFKGRLGLDLSTETK